MTGKGVEDIACGQNHSAAICDNGQLYCWGSSEHGQCGLGTDSKKIPSPEPVRLLTPASVCQHGIETPERQHRARQVSCGTSHSVAASTDGCVWVWGSGVQLGLGENRNSLTPVMLDTFRDKSVLKVHCGDYHSVVIVEHNDGEKEQHKSKDKTTTAAKASTETNPIITGVRTAKESPCVECNKLLGHDAGSAIESQDHVFQTDSASVHSGNQTVGASTDAGHHVSMIENHFGDNTTLKSSEDVSDAQTAAKTVEISETVGANAVVNDTDCKKIGNVDQGETTDETSGKTIDETKNKTSNETEDKTVLEASPAGMAAAGPEPAISEPISLDPASLEGDIGDPLGVTGGTKISSAGENMVSETETKESQNFDVVSLSEVQLRSKQAGAHGEDPLTQSMRSTVSVGSSTSSKSRSKTFLNEMETREFLAKQFEDDDGSCFVKGSVREPVTTSTPKREVKGSLDEGVKQDLGTLTSFMTTSLTSFTSKAIGNITSVFSMSDDPETTADSKKEKGEQMKEKATDQKSDRASDRSAASDRSESPGLDESSQEMYTLGDITTNVSLMSLPDAETSLQSEAVTEASPRKKREGTDKETSVKKPVQGSPVTVSKQSQSIRTIEAKQEQLRKRSSNFPQAGKLNSNALANITQYLVG